MKSKTNNLDVYIKISITIGVLVLSFSIAYYLIIFLPQKERIRVEKEKQIQLVKEKETSEKEAKERENELQVKITKCFEDGKKFHKEYVDSNKGYYFEPKYNYNKKIEKCLYSGGYGDSLVHSWKEANSGNNHWDRIVKDVYTNEMVLYASDFYNTEEIEEFWKEHNELMSN